LSIYFSTIPFELLSVFLDDVSLADLEMRKKPAASLPEDGELRMRPAASLPDVEHPRKRPAASLPEKGALRKRPASAPKTPKNKASPFHGTLVAECIAVNVQRLGEPAAKDFMEKLLNRTWTTSGACSGTGIVEVAFSALMDHFGADHSYQFMCEKESRKQHFLHETATIFAQGEVHIFDDISTLQSGVGACAGHGEKMTCEVSRGADFFTCGFSCKDFSKLSNKFTATE
jgi:hypothetical protein